MIALDTNVLIYACDRSDPQRQQTAIQLVTSSIDGVLLWQVACEFVAASRKLSTQGFSASDAWSRLDEFLGLFRLVLPSEGVLNRAQGLHVSHKVSFWDAMILAACLEVGVEILYSEDVPGLDAVDRLRVVNPFATV
jgi:predicted nucleic acid-binding protein